MDFDTFIAIASLVVVAVCLVICRCDNVRCTYKDQKIPQKKGAKK